MNDCIKVLLRDINLLAFEKLGKVDPVVFFLVKFETVIELVHLNVFGVVALQDFSEDPSV